MNNYEVFVNANELQNVLASLKKQREVLSNEYKESICDILEESSSCLEIASVDITEINNSFRDVFNDIDTNLEALINVLENKVIKNYTDLSDAIKNSFNNDFKNQLDEIMK